MKHHYINKGQEQCRVGGCLLVAPDNKPKRSNQCTEFAATLGILLTTSTHVLNSVINANKL